MFYTADLQSQIVRDDPVAKVRDREKQREIWKNNDAILRPRNYSQNRNKIYIF